MGLKWMILSCYGVNIIQYVGQISIWPVRPASNVDRGWSGTLRPAPRFSTFWNPRSKYKNWEKQRINLIISHIFCKQRFGCQNLTSDLEIECKNDRFMRYKTCICDISKNQRETTLYWFSNRDTEYGWIL